METDNKTACPAGIAALLLVVTLVGASQARLPEAGSRGLEPATRITQYVHEAWTTEHGLPQNTVAAIAQTPDGYLWLGTRFGLVRFDGVRFTVFHPRNTPGLAQDDIRSLLVDHQGALWIGTHRGGISRLQAGRFTAWTAPDSGFPDNFISCMHEDATGQLWLGTGGGLARRLPNGLFETVPGVTDRIHALHMDRASVLWIGANSGLYTLQQGRILPHRDEQGTIQTRVRAIHAEAGTLYLGTPKGLIRLNGSQRTIWTTADGLSSSNIAAITRDSRGSLWVGTWGGGINRFHQGRWSAFGSRQGLSDGVVVALFEDREGSLWLGTHGGGLNRFRNPLFTAWTASEGFPGGTLWTVCPSQEGGLWVGTNGRGLLHFKDGQSQRWTMKDGLPSDIIMSTCLARDGRLWIGTHDGLARLERGKIINLARKEGFPRGNVRALFEDRSGNLWIGSEAGLQRWHDGEFIQELKDALPDWLLANLLGIRQTDDGCIWLATVGGLRRVSKGRHKRFSVPEGLSHLVVTALHADGDDIWCGTEEGALNLRRNGAITIFPLQDQVPIKNILAILEDKQGNLWLSTSQGIVRLRKKELLEVAAGSRTRYAVRLFDQRDGLKSREMTGQGSGTGCRTADGRLWFASAKGMVMLDPQKVRSAPPPPAIIEQILVDDLEIQPEDQLNLSPGKQRMEIRYTSSSLLNPQRTRFRYKMEGLDETWIEADTRRIAYYTHIPAGQYRFLVQAANEDGEWGEVPAMWSFRMKPHVYETTWFQGVCVIATILSIAGLYRLRTRQLQRRSRQLKRLVAERTLALQQEIGERELAQEALRQSRDELEKRVAERTAALAALNQSLEQDIAQRRQTELALRESEERCRRLAEAAFEGLAIHDKGVIVDANPAMATMFGYSLDEMIGRHALDFAAPEAHAFIVEKIQSGSEDPYEALGLKKDGSRFLGELIGKPIPYHGRACRVTAIRDITEREQAEEHMRASLAEKEVLLKEIHHRVKNNLQIIISLLNLQAAQLDPAVSGAFAESQNRVRSMALVHESLYRSDNLASVALAPHVENLCAYLCRCYGAQTQSIELRHDIADVSLDLDRAIPCSLIINELVSNALKYAFPAGRHGYVAVELHVEAKRYTLIVADNGVGLPAGLDFRRADTLGFQLVCDLTQQLRGTITHARDGGTIFRITFNVE